MARPATQGLMAFVSFLACAIGGGAIVLAAVLWGDDRIAAMLLGTMGLQALLCGLLFAAGSAVIGLLADIRGSLGPKVEAGHDRTLNFKPWGTDCRFDGREAVRLDTQRIAVKGEDGWIVFSDDAQAGRYFTPSTSEGSGGLPFEIEGREATYHADGRVAVKTATGWRTFDNADEARRYFAPADAD
ncbi:MAG: hypothetical protein WD341_06050 [Tistlia sp.]|uniref:hypothetical protein n=1 Tax=Tistlia sp. TaxID=3057121 RepID=UPI0034A598CD